MLSSAFALAPAARTGAPCKTECPRNDLTLWAVTPLRASLLSSRICLAGVGRCASWLIKPRERVLRCSSRLCFLRWILRGQPEFRGMRPATPTVSRNQYAPFRGSPTLGQFPSTAMGNRWNSPSPHPAHPLLCARDTPPNASHRHLAAYHCGVRVFFEKAE